MRGSPLAEDPAGGFSAHLCDDYLAHLVEVGAHHQLVIASEDVCNEFGVVLLQAGTPLGAYALERMRGHHLVHPVDQSIALRRRLTAADLAGCFADLISGEADLARVQSSFEFEAHLRHLCHAKPWPAALLQKLTVLQLRLPKVFHRALFAAWLGALIAHERRLPAEDVVLTFRAGLLHDLGLLHIPADLVDKKADITPPEWALIQGHVGIGAALLAQCGLEDERLARVVREHHERHDGAGYPGGQLGADLDPVSALVALADMLHALRFQSLVLNTIDLADCMPYLRVNQRTFGAENYAPAGRVLLAGRDRTAPPPARGRTIPVQGLIDANRSLATLLEVFRDATPMLATLTGSHAARSLVTLLEQIQWIALSSGLGDEALERGLAEALAAGRDEPGIAEVQATTRELFWLVRRCDRLLEELLAEYSGQDTAIALKDVKMRVASEATRAWRRFESGSRG